MVHPAQGQMVQDLAASDLGAPPSRYVLREKDRPAAAGATQAQPELAAIPTVDVARLADPGDVGVGEAAGLRSALQSWGLFAVTGHGMPEPFLDEVLAATREFFHLPPEEKERYSNVVDVDGGGGEKFQFQPEGYGIDRVDTDEQILDWCDRLYLQVQPEEERRLEFWPAHPPALRPLLEEYTLRSEQVFRRVLAATARALGFDEEFFSDKVGERVATYARFTYYPPCPQPELVYGLKPHTDNSVLTVLLLDKNVGGLQLFKDGRWLDIPVLTHELLVVAGDEIEIMSNGVFMAPVHRVVTSDRERMSVVMFYQPEPHKDLAPSEELVGEERPALYTKLKAKDFGDGFWDAFAAGERTIDFLKVKVEQQKPEAAAVSS
ncbi:flavonol synthase/flavanone 3-hydroxylase-like [Oryza brachyantha]|uniref:flavonol synthase/flavanone 3-hydroxylase-like n=1 Tax=Oryza brachyantha TaxID=4533 RepID=UPI001AD975D8|nr:flavonol synthase/flavanone 3-hydroxylase-like [Oryza brachyantha]